MSAQNVYFVVDQDGDALSFEGDEKLQAYLKSRAGGSEDLKIFVGSPVEVVPAQIVVKGTVSKAPGRRGPAERDSQNRPLRKDGQPYGAPRNGVSNGTSNNTMV